MNLGWNIEFLKTLRSQVLELAGEYEKYTGLGVAPFRLSDSFRVCDKASVDFSILKNFRDEFHIYSLLGITVNVFQASKIIKLTKNQTFEYFWQCVEWN